MLENQLEHPPCWISDLQKVMIAAVKDKNQTTFNNGFISLIITTIVHASLSQQSRA